MSTTSSWHKWSQEYFIGGPISLVASSSKKSSLKTRQVYVNLPNFQLHNCWKIEIPILRMFIYIFNTCIHVYLNFTFKILNTCISTYSYFNSRVSKYMDIQEIQEIAKLIKEYFDIFTGIIWGKITRIKIWIY